MQSQRAKITLSGPPQLTSSDLWAQIWSGLSLQFPLKNLHWKPATRTSIRTIQALDVSLLALELIRDEGASQIPLSILDKPLLNVYVLTCEENETYKSSFRKQLKDWHAQVTQRKCQEWVIINLTKPETRQSQTGLLKMRGTVIDRIRADFNVDKRDRCAQVTWSSDLKSPAIWAEALSKLKDGIITAFDQAVSQREEEVKRSELQKTMPGWNFCTFFILKESLASSFEGAHLLEDALIQYEELEASFFQVLKDKTLWFGNFIEPSSKDDSLPLLSLSKKPYRDLILANTISVFDIRVYLLARQSIVLGQMGRLSSVTRKVSIFLGGFGGRLQEFESILPEFFIESWIYSSALSAVETCDEWARSHELDSGSLSRFNAGKGELLAAARSQLDKIGVRLGYLPNEPPFVTAAYEPQSYESTESSEKHASRQISNPDILGFLDNKSSFYDLYVKITNKAIDLFVKAGRRKFALKLHGSLAALDVFRERFGNALQTFTSLPAHYAPHRWASLEAFMLFQSMESHSQLQSNRDRQWIHTAVAFIRAYLEDDSMDLLSGMIDKISYIKRLIDHIAETASKVDGELEFQDHSMIKVVPVLDSARCANDKDGFLLDVSIHNCLPCALVLDGLVLYVAGREHEILKFTSGAFVAEPGVHSVTLFCPVPKPGAFLVEKVEVRLGHLLFQWSFAAKQKRTSTTTESKTFPKLIKLPNDSRAVRIDIQQPRKVEVAGCCWFSVSICSGRNSITRLELRLTSSEVTINLKDGALRSADVDLAFLEDKISLKNIRSEQTILFDVPHTRADSRDMIKVKAEIEYETAAEPGVVRRLTIAKEVPLALDLAVNVQDFFRGEKLLTKFTISTTTHQHVRISSVDLRPSDVDGKNLKVSKYNRTPTLITVTPAQPASFIFQLEKTGEVNEPLRLCMIYRLLREEVESIVTRRIRKVLPESDQWEQRKAARDVIVGLLEENSSWVEMYEITGEIHPSGKDLHVEGVLSDSLSRIKQALQEPEEIVDEEEDRRQFIIPVDLPHLDILVSTHISLVANPFDKEPLNPQQTPVYAGQPITAIISIGTSFFWAGPDKRNVREYKLRFQLDENIKDWLISGQKRGDFIAKEGSKHTMTVTLMALRHGELPLPNILVSAYPQATEQSSTPPSLETYQAHGAERLLVLPRGGRTTFFLDIGREQ